METPDPHQAHYGLYHEIDSKSDSTKPNQSVPNQKRARKKEILEPDPRFVPPMPFPERFFKYKGVLGESEVKIVLRANLNDVGTGHNNADTDHNSAGTDHTSSSADWNKIHQEMNTPTPLSDSSAIRTNPNLIRTNLNSIRINVKFAENEPEIEKCKVEWKFQPDILNYEFPGLDESFHAIINDKGIFGVVKEYFYGAKNISIKNRKPHKVNGQYLRRYIADHKKEHVTTD